MSILAIRAPATPAEPCWQCVPGAGGPMCPDHARLTRTVATAQARPDYRALLDHGDTALIDLLRQRAAEAAQLARTAGPAPAGGSQQ